MAACPRCRCTSEDKQHIIRCPQEAEKALWYKALQDLKAWMTTELSDPQIIQDILNGLQAWYNNTDSPKETSAAHQQSRLGWEAFLDGCLCLEWRAQQDAYWAQWRCRKSSKWWTTELIKKIWTILWDQWDHHNEALHNDTNNQEVILESKINSQVRDLFCSSPQAVPHDAMTLFKGTLDKLLRHSMQYKEQWAASVAVAAQCKKQHDYGAYLSKQRGMRRWLGLEPTSNSGT